MFIGIESLAANALIEIINKTNRREVDFASLVKYGMKIVKLIQEQTGEEAILLLSKKYQMNMIDDYSDFFEMKINANGYDVFKLRDDITAEDLSEYFRWTMSIRVIRAFMSEEAIMELGVVA